MGLRSPRNKIIDAYSNQIIYDDFTKKNKGNWEREMLMLA